MLSACCTAADTFALPTAPSLTLSTACCLSLLLYVQAQMIPFEPAANPVLLLHADVIAIEPDVHAVAMPNGSSAAPNGLDEQAKRPAAPRKTAPAVSIAKVIRLWGKPSVLSSVAADPAA